VGGRLYQLDGSESKRFVRGLVSKGGWVRSGCAQVAERRAVLCGFL